MITSLLSNDITQAMAWTLLHSLWQITLIASLLCVLLKVAHNASSSQKYYMSVSALLLSIISVAVTFSICYTNSAADTTHIYAGIVNQLSLDSTASSIMGTDLLTYFSDYYYIIVNAWIIGTMLFLIRFLGGFIYLKDIVAKSSDGSDKLASTLKRINKKYRINRLLSIKESNRITTPMVIGYIKPVILFPMGLVAHLSVSEVEAILAHELAHIKRHDYLLNILQIITESVFYYHPGLWYISSRIRHERENCCDDKAIQMTNSSMSYAKTLIKLQELKPTGLQTSLALTGSKNQFTKRIQRILGTSQMRNYTRDKVMLLCIVITSACLYATGDNPEVNKDNDYNIYVIDDCPQKPEDIKLYLDTIPERNYFKIKKQSQQKDIELEMDNGEITKLKIDGKEIPSDQYDEHEKIIEDLKPDNKSDIITLFPQCDDDMGRVYFLDKLNDQVINLDSLMTDLKLRSDGLEKFDYKFFDFADKENLEQTIIDSVENKLKDFYTFELDRSDENILQFDSLEKLLEGKYSNFFPFESQNSFPDNIEALKGLEGIELFTNEDWTYKFEDFKPENFFRNGDRIFDFPQDFIKGEETLANIIARSMLKDGIIAPDAKSRVEISGKHLKVDGEKQPTNLWRKYKDMYEKNTGIGLQKNSKVHLDVDPTEIRDYRMDWRKNMD